MVGTIGSSIHQRTPADPSSFVVQHLHVPAGKTCREEEGSTDPKTRGRFKDVPTGSMHLGNVYEINPVTQNVSAHFGVGFPN